MTTTFILAMIGAPEIIIVAILVLLIFGGKKIPELMRGLGKGMREFKDAQKEDTSKPTAENTKNQE
jgi:sec-independent protein translocase protein TatA